MNHSEAMRNVAPPLKRKRSLAQITAWLENDATWKPAYKLAVAAVLTAWVTVFLIGLCACVQVAGYRADVAEIRGQH